MTDSPDTPPEPAALNRYGQPRQRRSRARRAIVPTAEMLADAPEFAPVPQQRQRHDGWSYERQRAFAAAWADALRLGVQKLEDIAFERAINGVPVPVFHKGEQVGEKRWFNDRLLMWILRHHNPDRYGGRPDNHTPPHLRKAGFGKEEDLSPEQREERQRAGMDKVVHLYRTKVSEEMRYRREGRLDSAEFAMRQMTFIEILIVSINLQSLAKAIDREFPFPKWGRPLGDADRERIESIEAGCRELREEVMAEERERLEGDDGG